MADDEIEYTFKMKAADYKAWDLRQTFTAAEASCLWYGLDPCDIGGAPLYQKFLTPDGWLIIDKQDLLKKIERMKGLIEEHILILADNKSRRTSKRPDSNKISRDELKSFAENIKKMMPAFLKPPKEREDSHIISPVADKVAHSKAPQKKSIKKSTSPTSKTKKTLPQKNRPANAPAKFKHSNDFRSISYKGKTFTLTPNQARVVEILFEHHQKGTPDVGQAYILEELGTPASRLRDVFRSMPAWRMLVTRGSRRGTYRLKI